VAFRLIQPSAEFPSGLGPQKCRTVGSLVEKIIPFPMANARLAASNLPCLTGCHAPCAPMFHIQGIFIASMGHDRDPHEAVSYALRTTSLSPMTMARIYTRQCIRPCEQLPFPHHPPDWCHRPNKLSIYLNVSHAPSFPLFVPQIPANLQYCLEIIRKAHKEQPSRSPTCRPTTGLRLSRRRSPRASTSPRAQSVSSRR